MELKFHVKKKTNRKTATKVKHQSTKSQGWRTAIIRYHKCTIKQLLTSQSCDPYNLICNSFHIMPNTLYKQSTKCFKYRLSARYRELVEAQFHQCNLV
jgi:hypothetical protein